MYENFLDKSSRKNKQNVGDFKKRTIKHDLMNS